MTSTDEQNRSELARLARETSQCQRCALFQHATQAVFGEGPLQAAIMMVGEQPGDQEDRSGRPFVGPAGRVLDDALRNAGLDRKTVYITNVVKHFKHEDTGGRRLHKHPNRYEIERCRWWLDQEFKLVAPKLIVALGAAAASAMMNRSVTLTRERGKLLRWPHGVAGLVTLHPSAVLRMPEAAARAYALESLTADLRLAARLAASLGDQDYVEKRPRAS